MAENLYDDALAAARQAAYAAGEEIRRFIGKPGVTSIKSSPNDLVTEVDKRCQDIIVTHLLRAYSHSTILSEEQVAPGADAASLAVQGADTRMLWVVDPIDGTLNFIRGIPACTVSIGLVLDGQASVGVIYDPLRDELFAATLAGGAYLNEHALRVSNEAQLERAVLAAGFPSDVNASRVARTGPTRYHARNMRALGSAALHLAYVAAGRLDGYLEADLNAWDLCAGAVLVQAAGGRVSGIDGTPYSLATRDVVATNGLVHEAMMSDFA